MDPEPRPNPPSGGRSPEALATPGTRTAPARPHAPRIEDPAPVRALPDTRPAPEAALGGRPVQPAPAIRPRPGIGTTPDTGPSTPGQHPTGQPSRPDSGLNPITRPGGQPDGPPTVGGGEKSRGDVYHDGQLYRWDDEQQRWNSIARVDPGAALSPAGGNPRITSSGRPRIADLDQIFSGQPAQRQRYEDLSTKPANTLTPDEFKFVRETRQRQTIDLGETMTKVVGKDAADKIIDGTYQPDVVRGFVARARDTDQLRTPQQLRDGLALDDSFSIAAAKAKADEAIANGKTPIPGTARGRR